MENLDSLNAVHQGSEVSFEYSKRLTQAAQHEAQKPVEQDQNDGAPAALQWLESKNKQMNEFLKQLERDGMQRNKFEVPS